MLLVLFLAIAPAMAQSPMPNEMLREVDAEINTNSVSAIAVTPPWAPRAVRSQRMANACVARNAK